MTKKITALFFLLLSVFIFAACGTTTPEEPTGEDVLPTAITINNSITKMEIGDNLKLQLTVVPSGATNKNVTFLSSDKTVVSVDADGNIKALKAGTITITVTSVAASSIKATFSIEIAAEEVEEIKPTVAVTEQAYVLNDNNLIAKITATLNKGTYENAVVEYTSLNPTIVTVDASGNLTGLKGGNGYVEVSVKDFPETKITIQVEVYQNITSTNPTTIFMGESAQLEFLIDGAAATNVSWSTLEEKVATVDGSGMVTSVAIGEVVIRGVSGYFTYESTVNIITNPSMPTSIEITMDASEPLFLDSPIKFNVVVTPLSASPEVAWSVSKDFIATINSYGIPSFGQGGEVVFTAISTLDPKVSASISINMPNFMNPVNWVNQIKYDTLFQEVIYIHGMQNQDDPHERGPLKLITGSITKYFFTPLVINDTKYVLPKDRANYSGKTMTSTDFITVHSTGSYTGTAAGTANWCIDKGNGASWHFSVGSDGIFQSLPLTLVGYHAGDGTGIKNAWYDTGILATDNTPGYVAFSDDGYYIVNGQKSTLKASQTFNGSSLTITVNSRTRIPYTGFNTKIGENGNYYVGTIYWNGLPYTESGYNTLSNRGGNLNSIGIESTINVEENIMHTWSNLAKLVGELCRQKRLDPAFAVKQHNTFSGKDCPMTMRHASEWEYFMDMVFAEYNAAKYLKGFNIELIENSPYIASNGLIISYPTVATEVEYQVRISNSAVGYDQTFTLRSIIPAAKTVIADNARHIRASIDIVRAPYQA